MTIDSTAPPTWPTKPPWIHRAWVGPVAGLIAFVAVLALALSVAGAFALRVAEADRLVTAIEASEAAMVEYQESVEAQAQVLGGASEATDEEKVAALDEVVRAAARGEEAVGRAGEAVAALRFVPWNRDLARARDAYLEHNRAWQDYLGRVAEDPAALAEPDPLIDSTFMDAEVVIRDSVPRTSLRDLSSRVDVIFAVPLDTSGGQLA